MNLRPTLNTQLLFSKDHQIRRQTAALLIGTALLGVAGAIMVFRQPHYLIPIVLYTGITLLGLTILIFIFGWSLHLRFKDRAQPNLTVRYHGFKFLLWFAGHNIAWAAAGFLTSALLLKIFGTQKLIIAYSSGAFALSFFVLAGILPIRNSALLGLCWRSTVPKGVAWLLARCGATVLLGCRFKYAVAQDLKQPEPFFHRITGVLELARTRKVERLLQFERSESTSIKNEILNRLKVLSLLMLTTAMLTQTLFFVPIDKFLWLSENPVYEVLQSTRQTENEAAQVATEKRAQTKHSKKLPESGTAENSSSMEGGQNAENLLQTGEIGQNLSDDSITRNLPLTAKIEKNNKIKGGDSVSVMPNGFSDQSQQHQTSERPHLGQQQTQDRELAHHLKNLSDSPSPKPIKNQAGEINRPGPEPNSRIAEKKARNQQPPGESAKKTDYEKLLSQAKHSAGNQKGNSRFDKSQPTDKSKFDMQSAGPTRSPEGGQMEKTLLSKQSPDRAKDGGNQPGGDGFGKSGGSPNTGMIRPGPPLQPSAKKGTIPLALPSLVPSYAAEISDEEKLEVRGVGGYLVNTTSHSSRVWKSDKPEKPIQFLPNWIVAIAMRKN